MSQKSPPAKPFDEAALYRPVKHFLEQRGYEVKGEVHRCDVVACRTGEPPLIVELKLRFNLALVLQGIDRLRISERVYLAVPRPSTRSRGVTPEAAGVRRLCRRLGLGLMMVGCDTVTVIEEPVPYRPRQTKGRILRLIAEFERRTGDPNTGGRTRTPIVTAYRQDSLRCARALANAGPLPLRALRTQSGVAHAARMLQRNVYGWFVRVSRGVYGLSDSGRLALVQFADAVPALPQTDPDRAAA